MATKDDIIKYVQHTPENTNPSVLGGLLSDLQEGKSIQPDWNQNDETAADYVKNRPFYDSPLMSVLFPHFPEGAALYKVSDAVPIGDHSVNASCIIALSNGGKNETKEATIDISTDDYYMTGEGFIFVVLKDNVAVTENGPTFPEKGTYFFSYEDMFISGFALGSGVDLEITWNGNTGEIKKLNEKFLPDPLILYRHVNDNNIVYKNDNVNNPEYATTKEVQRAFFGRGIFIKTSDGIYEKAITFNPTDSILETKSNSYCFYPS